MLLPFIANQFEQNTQRPLNSIFCVKHVEALLEINCKRPDALYRGTQKLLLPRIRARRPYSYSFPYDGDAVVVVLNALVEEKLEAEAPWAPNCK